MPASIPTKGIADLLLRAGPSYGRAHCGKRSALQQHGTEDGPRYARVCTPGALCRKQRTAGSVR